MDNIVYKYFELSQEKQHKINRLVDVYEVWNQKINLISRKDFESFYERHVLHSLSICKVFSFKDGSKIMDLGSGGGFPGIPLAIMFPEVEFFLVDSIFKKTYALQDIVKELDLCNITVLNKRAEDVENTFDFIVCRAVAKLDQLNRWITGKISKKNHHEFKNGLICLKGGDLTKETKNFTRNLVAYSIKDFFEEDFFTEKKILYLTK